MPTLKNPGIAKANPDVRPNKEYIDALYIEAMGRKATNAEVEKFSQMTVKDAANIILGSLLSPFSDKNAPVKIEIKKQKLLYPMDKRVITQPFGVNPSVYAKFGLKGHNGCDFRTRFIDSPLAHRYVMAAHEGVVEEVRWDKTGYGTHIRLRLKGFGLTIYGHLEKSYVSRGQVIKAGQRIGLSGNTGFSSGAHLHFEVRPEPLKGANGFGGASDPIVFFNL